jgi:hypothetical protein
VCVCKVIDLVKNSPMEDPVSLHPHQAYSVLARALADTCGSFADPMA